MGMSEECYPDTLIGMIPNLYYHAANNPSVATIAKRRNYTEIIPYLTPPAENAGLYKGLKELNKLIASYLTLKDSARGIAIVNTIMDKCHLVNLDQDIKLSNTDAKDITLEQSDNIVGSTYRKLIEIESRLLPCGLHIIGKPPTAEEAIVTLVNIAFLDRKEEEIISLPRIIANTLGRNIEEIYQDGDRGILEDLELLQRITLATREAVTSLVKAQIDADRRISFVSKLSFLKMNSKVPWVETLH